MQLNSSAPPLAVELRDPDIRRHTVESQIKIGIPFQIRAMREHRGWTQETLAEKIGTTQNTISRLENPKTGKPTITTLLRIANASDVGLLVRFVPFGFYGDVINAMDQTHVEVPSYDEELKNQESELEAALAAHAAMPAPLDAHYLDFLYPDVYPDLPAGSMQETERSGWNSIERALSGEYSKPLFYQGLPDVGAGNSPRILIPAGYPMSPAVTTELKEYPNLIPAEVFQKHQQKARVSQRFISKEALRA